MDKLSYYGKILLKGALKKESKIMKIGIFCIESMFLLFSIIFLWIYFLKKYEVIFLCSLSFLFLFVFIVTIRTYQHIIRAGLLGKENSGKTQRETPANTSGTNTSGRRTPAGRL